MINKKTGITFGVFVTLLAVAAGKLCVFSAVNDVVFSICGWSKWGPWDCCNCKSQIAERYRGICCPDNTTTDACLKYCNVTADDGKSSANCSDVCTPNVCPSTFTTTRLYSTSTPLRTSLHTTTQTLPPTTSSLSATSTTSTKSTTSLHTTTQTLRPTTSSQSTTSKTSTTPTSTVIPAQRSTPNNMTSFLQILGGSGTDLTHACTIYRMTIVSEPATSSTYL